MTGGTTHKLRPSPYLLQVTSQTLFFPVRNYSPHTFHSERIPESHNLTYAWNVKMKWWMVSWDRVTVLAARQAWHVFEAVFLILCRYWLSGKWLLLIWRMMLICFCVSLSRLVVNFLKGNFHWIGLIYFSLVIGSIGQPTVFWFWCWMFVWWLRRFQEWLSK